MIAQDVRKGTHLVLVAPALPADRNAFPHHQVQDPLKQACVLSLVKDALHDVQSPRRQSDTKSLSGKRVSTKSEEKPGDNAEKARTCLNSPSRSHRSNMRSTTASRRASTSRGTGAGSTALAEGALCEREVVYESMALAVGRRRISTRSGTLLTGARTYDSLDVFCLCGRDVSGEFDIEELLSTEGERERLVEIAEVIVDLGADERRQLTRRERRVLAQRLAVNADGEEGRRQRGRQVDDNSLVWSRD